jgi:VIT1/CCC1 family predicted Fe2+/Mn2+ transporter
MHAKTKGSRWASTTEQANDLRAAVLGFNDGLLANLGLVMGVAGATMSNRAVIIAGLAGLIAGALSMALGEWISVQSSREMYGSRLAALTTAFDREPAATRTKLAAMEQARGLSLADSVASADQLMRDRDQALHALAAYELGIAYDDIGGSPWGAAAMAFLLFPAGAILSLIPFLMIADHTIAVSSSLGLAGLGLFGVGAAITRFTRRSALYSGFRQLAFGGIAALFIYACGRLFGGLVT